MSVRRQRAASTVTRGRWKRWEGQVSDTSTGGPKLMSRDECAREWRTLGRGHRALAPRRRRRAGGALERTIERRLRVVTDPRRNLLDVAHALAHHLLGELYPPVGEVVHRRLAHEVGE